MGRHPKLWLVAGITALAAGGLVLALALSSAAPRRAPAAHARVYLDTTACLLTSPRGVAPGGPGEPVWGAMEQASEATHVMVSYLPASGPAQVPVLLNTLVERRCGVIVSSGIDPGRVAAAAKANPHQRFLVVVAPGAVAGELTPNAQAVSSAQAPARVDRVIRALASGRS